MRQLRKPIRHVLCGVLVAIVALAMIACCDNEDTTSFEDDLEFTEYSDNQLITDKLDTDPAENYKVDIVIDSDDVIEAKDVTVTAVLTCKHSGIKKSFNVPLTESGLTQLTGSFSGDGSICKDPASGQWEPAQWQTQVTRKSQYDNFSVKMDGSYVKYEK